MAEIDNINLILPSLNFKSSDDFYYLQILQRKKENEHIGSNSRVIKNYYIRSEQHLLDRYEEIKTLCRAFNARASIRLNKRSFEKVAFKTLENIANTMQNKGYESIRNCYDRACGTSASEKEKKWIVDIDKDEIIWMEQIHTALNSCAPYFSLTVLKGIPSKNGVHLITTPFNTLEFKDKLSQELATYKASLINVEIHKDNPTNLFIP